MGTLDGLFTQEGGSARRTASYYESVGASLVVTVCDRQTLLSIKPSRAGYCPFCYPVYPSRVASRHWARCDGVDINTCKEHATICQESYCTHGQTRGEIQRGYDLRTLAYYVDQERAKQAAQQARVVAQETPEQLKAQLAREGFIVEGERRRRWVNPSYLFLVWVILVLLWVGHSIPAWRHDSGTPHDALEWWLLLGLQIVLDVYAVVYGCVHSTKVK